MDPDVGRPTLRTALREFPHLLDYQRGETHNDAAAGLRGVSLTKDPFVRMVTPTLLRRPSWSDVFPVWASDRQGSNPTDNRLSGAR